MSGTVADIGQEYDDWDGPQTFVTLKRAATHLGACTDASIMLPMPGGPLPDGSYLRISGIPEFVFGAKYLVFIAKSGWKRTPVVLSMALRYEKVASKSILVDDDGYPVRGISTSAIITRGQRRFFEVSSGDGPFSPRIPVGQLAQDDVKDLPSPETIVAAFRLRAQSKQHQFVDAYSPVRSSDHPWHVTPTAPPSEQSRHAE